MSKTFVLLEGGPCSVNGTTYEKGARLSSDQPLDKMFPGRWKVVGGAAAVLTTARKKVVEVPEEVEDEEEVTEEAAATETDEEEGQSATSADDVDVSGEFQLAAKKKVMVKLTPDKTHKLIDAESDELLKEGLSRTDVKKFLKTFSRDE